MRLSPGFVARIAALTIVLAGLAAPQDKSRSQENPVSFPPATQFTDGIHPIEMESQEFRSVVEEMTTRVSQEDASAFAVPNVDAAKIIANPGEHRGRFFRIYGHLVKLLMAPLAATTPSGVREVYVGYMQTHPDNRTVCIYGAGKPVGKDGRPITFNFYQKNGKEYVDNWITIEGVFLRTWEYEGQTLQPTDKPATVKAAVIFAKSVSLSAPPPPTDAKKPFVVMVIVAGGLVIGLVLLAGIVSRRNRGASLRERMLAHKRETAGSRAESAVGQEPEKPHP